MMEIIASILSSYPIFVVMVCICILFIVFLLILRLYLIFLGKDKRMKAIEYDGEFNLKDIGIVHFTTSQASKKIDKEEKIKCSKKMVSTYSNGFKPCCCFFINNGLNNMNLELNLSRKKFKNNEVKYFVITDLKDQADNLKIRPYDSVLFSPIDLDLSKCHYQVKDLKNIKQLIKKSKINNIEHKKITCRALIYTILTSIVCVLSILLIIKIICNS